MRSINVIGGGIVGLTSALALARAGLGVRVIERDRAAMAASWGNAGHIAVEQVAPLASPAMIRSVPGRLFIGGGPLDLPLGMMRHWAPFALWLLAASTPTRFAAGRDALRMLLGDAMPAWERLTDRIGSAELLRQDGHLVAWESAATAAKGRAAWARAEIGVAAIEDASSADRDVLERCIGAKLHDPLRFRGSGQITDLDRLADQLRAALAREGVDLVSDTARLSLDGDAVRIDHHPADAVLVAAGIGSRALMKAAGHHAPLIAERGYHIRAAADRWPAGLPPVVFEDRSMIVTRFADCVQAAGFVELGNSDAPPDPRKWARLEQHVAELGLAFGPPYQRWMGCRPTLPDYLPAIGRSRRAGNLYYAFGHQHLGLTLAPVTAEIVANLVTEKDASINLSAFDIERFGKGERT